MVNVVFSLPAEVDGAEAAVVAEFNDWSHTANPMVRGPKGFTVAISLPAGNAYRFRYLIDGSRWENDWDADAYLPNAHGQDDSVVDLTSPVVGTPAAPPAPASPTGAKKATAKSAGISKKSAAKEAAAKSVGTTQKSAAEKPAAKSVGTTEKPAVKEAARTGAAAKVSGIEKAGEAAAAAANPPAAAKPDSRPKRASPTPPG